MAELHKLRTLIPLQELEISAQQQIYANLELDFLRRMVVLPDCHAGYDLPVGAVALLDGHISPSYVGMDIGCGMCFVNTGLSVRDSLPTKKSREKLWSKICRNVPHGLGIAHEKPVAGEVFMSSSGNKILDKTVNKFLNVHLGTLGAGNHFIEIGEDSAGKICVTIHSGSRRPGGDLAAHYIKLGRFFALDSDLGRAYLADLDYFLEYALKNRLHMMTAILEHIPGLGFNDRQKLIKEIVNENHNHAVVTPEGVLHRKGATPADKDQLGIIPANMRDGVWLTKGLGNDEYLSSSSHGAGRVMSRGQAKKKISVEQFERQMKGILATTTKGTLDEAPDAYKKIDRVIELQVGRVIEVIDHIKPLINIKGENKQRRRK